ncbi:MAG: aminotransferase class V-fold PLP-dependent enzyme [Eudoraea sp.]|uniref:aminotransferase class V-fold PLP-dependent enzyme n=1 Tax=Eudoraea sp. TaxID=1979955 RepID=UPI003C75F941
MLNNRKSYPVLNHCIYANTAAYGLLGEELLEWRQNHDLDYLIGGSSMKIESLGLISEARDMVGTFFKCKSDLVALVPNFSLGLNMLLEGLDSREHILLLENDYPSVNWPLESRGFQISYAKIDEKLEQNILEKVRTNSITVLALSLVQWINGIRVDLDFLKSLKEEFPQLMIIADGTQLCGAFEIDFENSGIDVLGASGYKWLLAGTGNGFMLFKDLAKVRFTIKTTGFNSANAVLTAKNTIPFNKQFEPGHLDSLNFGSLKCALGVLNDIGMKEITAHNENLSKKACKGFSELGLLNKDIIHRNLHSTIFNIKGNNALFNHLMEENIVCSRRGEGIRLSFHHYNTVEDIDSILEILRKMK